ncbi:MFS transporter [Herbiconiux sp.]|uniref:MFS transporter n=1 Tax=Herbiconiux sp. TaxID=1871186 RepID=UPI0025C45637|nr:MFS transporter [Herbiconiux sp.]
MLVFAAVNLVVLGALTAPVVTGLPILIARLVPEGERTGVLAFVTVCGAIASVVANPVFGAASDRTPGRFGRRRPWLLGGVVLGFGATVLVLNAGSVAALAVGWVLAQTAYNASLAAVAALLGDQVEERRRASASGIFGAAAFLGTLPPLALAALVPDRLDIVMLTMPTAALAVGVVACLVIRDTPLAQVRRTSLTGSARRLGLRGLELRRHRLFAWVWLQRFLLQLAFSLVTAFTLYFVAIRFVLSPEGASPVVAVTTFIGAAGIVLSALVTGFVASRRGRYAPFIVAASLGLAAAAALRALAPDVPVLWAGAALGGIALGAFYAVDLALALRAIPPGRTGTFLGVFNIAETVPQAIAPALALGLLALAGPDPVTDAAENYTALYLVAGGVALLALLPLPFLRPILTRAAPAGPAPRVPR